MSVLARWLILLLAIAAAPAFAQHAEHEGGHRPKAVRTAAVVPGVYDIPTPALATRSCTDGGSAKEFFYTGQFWSGTLAAPVPPECAYMIALEGQPHVVFNRPAGTTKVFIKDYRFTEGEPAWTDPDTDGGTAPQPAYSDVPVEFPVKTYSGGPEGGYTRFPAPTGPPPAYAYQPANPTAGIDLDTWTVPASGIEDDQFKPAPPSGDPKFRTVFGPATHLLPDDSIRNWCQPGAAHLHQFFGNTGANACSTYTSLRTTGESGAAGDAVAGDGIQGANGVAYWVAAFLREMTVAGKRALVAPRIIQAGSYYSGPGLPFVSRLVSPPRGFREIVGRNMDDPDGLYDLSDIVADWYKQVALAGQSTAVVNLRHEPQNGFLGYFCEDLGGTTYAAAGLYLANADGSARMDCPVGLYVAEKYNGAYCWNGKDRSSPGGYRHVRAGYTMEYPFVGGLCPNGWFTKTTVVGLHIIYPSDGAPHLWRRVSDNPAGDAAGRFYRNGESGHADWKDGFEHRIRVLFDVNCGGVPVEGVSSAHECDSSRISLDRYLRNGGGLQQTPTTPTTADGQWFIVDPDLDSGAGAEPSGRGRRPGRPGRPGRRG